MTDWHQKHSAPAKFRGVPFLVDNGEQTGGRNGPVHEVPFGEDPPFSEDTGRKGRAFAIEGFVLGLEYVAARDALLKALETPGPGELVHPYYGTLRVKVDTYRVREQRSPAGIATFTIAFLETSSGPAAPKTVPDPEGVVAVARESLLESLRAQFLSGFSRVAALRASAVGAVRSASLAVDAVLEAHALGAQEMAALKRSVLDFSGSAEALVNAPETLLNEQVSLFDALADGLSTAAGLLDPSGAMLRLYSYDPGQRPPETTPNREVERANFDALQHLTQRLALVGAAKLVVGQTFDSFDAAQRVRVAITDLLDLHTEDVTDDTYPACMALRAALVNAVPGPTSDLPRLQHYTPASTVPSLVLAHQLYGGIDLEEDLIRRNRISNPGFILGGRELEVLSK